MSAATRFAPSPTGPLHLGHAFSAIVAHDLALRTGGRFLLRIEDIDTARSKPEWEAAIFEDLAWLGLVWAPPAMRQSDRVPAYEDALDRLWRDGLLYRCDCTRRDIAEAARAPQEGAPAIGPDGPIYPGTCRPARGHRRAAPRPAGAALRLDLAAALDRLAPAPLGFVETGPDRAGTHAMPLDALPRAIGDIVLSRRDFAGSYHLSVVLDDAAQGVTCIPRGADLFEATWIHVLLQRLFGLPTPAYHHHRLIRDAAGKRLAKRDDARALAAYRAQGDTPQDIRARLADELRASLG